MAQLASPLAARSGAMAVPLVEAKAALRKSVRARLRALDVTDVEAQSEAVCQRLSRNPWYMASRSIGLFLSMPRGELQTEPILRDAFASGKRIFCPRVMGDGWMEMFEVSGLDEALKLPRSKWGIPEPPADNNQADPTKLDMILVPAVALDVARRRCGHGMGFYDRYIARARAGGRCHTIGLGLLEQREASVPTEEHDEPLDGVLFPDLEVLQEEEEPTNEPVSSGAV
mmetsp:Transcript_90888/g.256744  ORF Transcript_90888/g.256744 Transcript_90888/m.256744 type:complete len:228 (+) Transcript_90888:227-910(+)